MFWWPKQLDAVTSQTANRPISRQSAKMVFFWIDHKITSDFFCKNELLSFSEHLFWRPEKIGEYLHKPFREKATFKEYENYTITMNQDYVWLKCSRKYENPCDYFYWATASLFMPWILCMMVILICRCCCCCCGAKKNNSLGK